MRMKQVEKSIIIFADGSCLGNPGTGGWGAIVSDGDDVVELGGHGTDTTNNRMEITAVISALRAVKDKKGSRGQGVEGTSKINITVYTDSSYVISGVTRWISKWERSGWLTGNKMPVKNRELWEELSSLVRIHEAYGKISWKHVGGHVGVEGNERADEIASAFAEGKQDIELYHGAISGYAHNLKNISGSVEKRARRSESKTRKNMKAYSYLSLVGGALKRHATWGECERRVKGVPGAKFKKAVSREDEKDIMRAWGVKI